MNAPAPTVETVQYYLTKWKNSTATQKAEKFLSKLFLETYPTNTDFDEVLTKVCALNCLYSTNLQHDHLVLVAEHLTKQPNLDARLAAGDMTLLEDITYIQIASDKKQSFYSFMTKYCGHHVKPLAIDDARYSCDKEFPAFDGIVEEMLRDFNFKDHFTEMFEKSDLKQYWHYVKIMKQMRKHYKLEGFTFKELDIYLNLCGRNEIKNQKNKKKLARKPQPARRITPSVSTSNKGPGTKKPRHKHSGKGAYAKPRESSLYERPQSNSPSSNRPQSERPTGGSNRPSSGRPQGGSRPTGGSSRPSSGRPQGGRPTGGSSRPSSGRPQGGRPTDGSSRPSSGRPQGGRPTGGSSRLSSGRPQGGRPTGGSNRPSSGRPQGGRPTGGSNRPSSGRPQGGRPTGGSSRTSRDRPQGK